MNTWNNKGSRELIGHSKHFGTRFALDSVTVYPIIFPDNQGQVRLTQADFYFFIPSVIIHTYYYLQVFQPVLKSF